MIDTTQCQCAVHGFCTRRNAYVPRPQWRQCQAGQCTRVDKVISDLANAVDYSKKQRVHKHRQGPIYNHWCPLHYYAPSRSSWDQQAARKWFYVWESKIPDKNGCNCSKNWKEHNLTPDFSSAVAFFEWTWFAQDQVTRHIISTHGRGQLITLAECYEIWWPNVTKALT